MIATGMWRWWIFVSSDKLNWTAVGAFEAQKVLEEQIFSVTPTKGRYFKIKITDSYRASNSSLAEINAYGIDWFLMNVRNAQL